jgi:mannose-6-phosphate isomerase-like protein (cupin superfamily)
MSPTIDLHLQSELKSAHQRLRNAATHAAKKITDETRIIESHNDGNNSGPVSTVMVSGKWGRLFEGIKIMLIDNDEICTRAICEGSGLAPLHFHKFDEKIIVVSGYLIDNLSKKIFYPGETIYHPANEKHQPEINGTIICVWTPPLPLLKPLESIEGMQDRFDVVRKQEWKIVK